MQQPRYKTQLPENASRKARTKPARNLIDKLVHRGLRQRDLIRCTAHVQVQDHHASQADQRGSGIR